MSIHHPIDWLWRLFESRVETAITNRIVTFHEALIDRGQISAPGPCGNGVELAALLDVAPARRIRVRIPAE